MGAPSSRISEVSRILVERGYHVSVITAVPNRPNGKIQSGFDKNYYYYSHEDNIHIHRVKVFLPKHLGVFGNRLITEASFCLFAFFFAHSIIRKSQFVIIQNPPLFSGLTAFFIKLIGKSKVINWCSDIWPDLLIELGALRKKSIMSWLMKLIQRINFFWSDAVAVTTPNTVQALQKNYNLKKIFLWRNGVDIKFFKPETNNLSFRKNWNLSNSKFVVGYAGLHGNFQNLNIVLDACKLLQLKNSKIHIVLVGDGVQKEQLKRRKLAENINNLSLFDPVKRESMPELLQSVDALIVPLARPMPTTIPSKFYESLAVGKPLIVASDSEISTMVADKGLGTVYSCGNEKSLAEAIHKLAYLDSESMKKIKENVRRLSFNFDRKMVVDKIEVNIEELL